MSYLVSKLHLTASTTEMEMNNNSSTIEDQEREEEEDSQVSKSTVTSHVYLKPAHLSGSLDKEAVLRQIRQRKRANNSKVRTGPQGFLGFLSPGKNTDKKVSVRWVDDAFAAP